MFKNLAFYRLQNGIPESFQSFCEGLESQAFHPCSGLEAMRTGWVGPRGRENIAYELGNDRLATLRIEKKIVPASVVNRLANEKAKEIENTSGAKLGKKAKKEIKQMVYEELLAKALSDIKDVNVWFDLADGWIGVDTSSDAVADLVVQAIGKSFPDAEYRLVQTEMSPAMAMRQWLFGDEPEGLSVGEECDLESLDEDKAKVKYSRHALDREDVRGHLNEGKLPKSLAMIWDDRMSFVLTNKGKIRKISFLDIVMEQHQEAMGDEEDSLASDLTLLTAEMRGFLPAIVQSLGGETKAVVESNANTA